MIAAEVPLRPVSSGGLSTAKIKDVCSGLLYGRHTQGADPYNFNGGVVNAVTGSCKEFDMAKQEDRAAYADLMARAVVAASEGSASPLILWEERIRTQVGGLIIYLCYVESEKTYDKYLKQG